MWLINTYTVLTIVSLHYHTAWCLTCYCSGSRLCTGNEVVCNEGEVCFVRLTEDLSSEYACYTELPQTIPGHSIEVCLKTGILLHFSSLLCCNDTDLCNRYLEPPTPPGVIAPTMAPETTPSVAESNPTTGPLQGNKVLGIHVYCLQTFHTHPTINCVMCSHVIYR